MLGRACLLRCFMMTTASKRSSPSGYAIPFLMKSFPEFDQCCSSTSIHSCSYTKRAYDLWHYDRIHSKWTISNKYTVWKKTCLSFNASVNYRHDFNGHFTLSAIFRKRKLRNFQHRSFCKGKTRTIAVVRHIKELLGLLEIHYRSANLNLFAGWGVPEPQCSM